MTLRTKPGPPSVSLNNLQRKLSPLEKCDDGLSTAATLIFCLDFSLTIKICSIIVAFLWFIATKQMTFDNSPVATICVDKLKTHIIPHMGSGERNRFCE